MQLIALTVFILIGFTTVSSVSATCADHTADADDCCTDVACAWAVCNGTTEATCIVVEKLTVPEDNCENAINQCPANVSAACADRSVDDCCSNDTCALAKCGDATKATCFVATKLTEDEDICKDAINQCGSVDNSSSTETPPTTQSPVSATPNNSTGPTTNGSLPDASSETPPTTQSPVSPTTDNSTGPTTDGSLTDAPTPSGPTTDTPITTGTSTTVSATCADHTVADCCSDNTCALAKCGSATKTTCFVATKLTEDEDICKDAINQCEVSDPTEASCSPGQRFDAASFVGGIVLAIGVIGIVFLGCKFFRAKSEQSYHQF